MIISRSFNREGIIKRRRSGNKGLRKERESVLAYVPNNFLNYRPFETFQSLPLVFKKSFNNLPENP